MLMILNILQSLKSIDYYHYNIHTTHVCIIILDFYTEKSSGIKN